MYVNLLIFCLLSICYIAAFIALSIENSVKTKLRRKHYSSRLSFILKLPGHYPCRALVNMPFTNVLVETGPSCSIYNSPTYILLRLEWNNYVPSTRNGNFLRLPIITLPPPHVHGFFSFSSHCTVGQ